MLLQWEYMFIKVLLELLIGIVDVKLLKPVNLVMKFTDKSISEETVTLPLTKDDNIEQNQLNNK